MTPAKMVENRPPITEKVENRPYILGIIGQKVTHLPKIFVKICPLAQIYKLLRIFRSEKVED